MAAQKEDAVYSTSPEKNHKQTTLFSFMDMEWR